MTPSMPDNKAMFDQFLLISAAWHLTETERFALLAGPKETLSELRANTPDLTDDQCERISHLANIYLNLHEIFGPPTANSWMRRPNDAFDGRTPLQFIMDEGLSGVRRLRGYLNVLL